MTGTIFDIRRFALNDGPGIRTVVFFKGCPLRCLWCCNPESISMEPQLAFVQKKCNNCGECIPVCQEKVFTNPKNQLKVNHEKCNLCRDCIETCTEEALKIYGYSAESGEIIEEAVKDKNYYENSGGGLTLSGGEPLYQPEFALEILQKAKQKNLHTCIETSGYASQQTFEQISPYTDVFLFDYKMTNESKHIKYTGKSNRKILDNLAWLNKQNKTVHLRCIIVPKLNDRLRHFKAIAELSEKYPGIEQVEVMPYHDFGVPKYREIGKPYHLEIDNVSKEQGKEWVEKLDKLGCKNVKLG